MSQALVTPYRTPSPDCITMARPWHDLNDPNLSRIEDRLIDWAPGTRVSLTRTIRVDVPRVLRECRLPDDARIALLATGVCATTTIRAASPPLVLDRSYTGDRELRLELHLDGYELAGSLVVSTKLVTYEQTAHSLIAPWRPGLTLWEDSSKIRLQGSGARFPMEACDFSKMGRNDHPSRAMWRLDWSPDALDEPVLGSMRLYLNSGHPMVRLMIDDATGEQSKVVASMIRYEVGRLMILTALDDTSFIEDPEQFGEDTVGEMLHKLVMAVGRLDSVEAIAARKRRNPVQFETELQSALHILKGVR